MLSLNWLFLSFLLLFLDRLLKVLSFSTVRPFPMLEFAIIGCAKNRLDSPKDPLLLDTLLIFVFLSLSEWSVLLAVWYICLWPDGFARAFSFFRGFIVSEYFRFALFSLVCTPFRIWNVFYARSGFLVLIGWEVIGLCLIRGYRSPFSESPGLLIMPVGLNSDETTPRLDELTS